MTYQNTDEIREEFRRYYRFLFDSKYDGVSDIRDEVLNWCISKMKAREQYLVGEIEKIRDDGRNCVEKNCIQCQVREAVFEKVLSVINPQESKKGECSRCNGNGCPACENKGSKYNPEPY